MRVTRIELRGGGKRTWRERDNNLEEEGGREGGTLATSFSFLNLPAHPHINWHNKWANMYPCVGCQVPGTACEMMVAV